MSHEWGKLKHVSLASQGTRGTFDPQNVVRVSGAVGVQDRVGKRKRFNGGLKNGSHRHDIYSVHFMFVPVRTENSALRSTVSMTKSSHSMQGPFGGCRLSKTARTHHKSERGARDIVETTASRPSYPGQAQTLEHRLMNLNGCPSMLWKSKR